MKLPVVLPAVVALFCASISLAQEKDSPRPEEVREKFQRVKREIEELRSKGHHEEVKRLEERVREEMGRQRGKRVEAEGSGGFSGEGEKPARWRHLAEAARHLREAGMPEAAERIERMGREQQEAARKSAPGEAAEPLHRMLREQQEQVHRAMKEQQEYFQKSLRETHEQLAKLAKAIEELRAQIPPK